MKSKKVNFCQNGTVKRAFAEIFHIVTARDKIFPSEKKLCQNISTVKKFMDPTFAPSHQIYDEKRRFRPTEEKVTHEVFWILFSATKTSRVCGRSKENIFQKLLVTLTLRFICGPPKNEENALRSGP